MQIKRIKEKGLYRIVQGLFVVLLFIAIINGCTKKSSDGGIGRLSTPNDVLTNDEKLSLMMKAQISHRISVNNAQQMSLAFLNKISSNSNAGMAFGKTISVSNVKIFWKVINIHTTSIKGINALANAASSRTTDSVPVYGFNFKTSDGNTAGFAVAAGDDRLPTVLACSDNGSLEDTTTNPGLAVFMHNLPTYVDSTIAKTNSIIDSLYQLATTKLDRFTKLGSTSVAGPVLASTEKSPLITSDHVVTITYPTTYGPYLHIRWGQGYPYNNDAPASNGCSRTPAGCVATAIAQILTFYKYPSYISYPVPSGTNLNWDLLNQFEYMFSRMTDPTLQQISALFRWIGNGVNMQYTCDNSGAYDRDAASFFNQIGYNTDGLKSYNTTTVINSLANQRLVYASGFRDSNRGHAWAIDGYIQERKQVDFTITIPMNEKTLFTIPIRLVIPTDYVHCNFGWDGENNQGTNINGGNGYYVSQVFHDYKNNQRMIANIRRK